jgi:hypothetical protein
VRNTGDLGEPMKLGEAVSWLTGSLQRNLIPCLGECWERPLTDKEQQLVSIQELFQKVNLHLIFGIIAWFADQMLKLAS